MKKIILFLCAVPLAGVLHAQTRDNATGKQFYVEAAGAGGMLSANIDSRFERNSSLGFGFRAGVGFALKDRLAADGRYRTHSVLTLPLGLNYVFGKDDSPHAFEVGAGVTVLTARKSMYTYNGGNPGNLMGHMSFMYRRKPTDGGFTWRIGLTPIIGTAGDIVPSGAIGVGYSF